MRAGWWTGAVAVLARLAGGAASAEDAPAPQTLLDQVLASHRQRTGFSVPTDVDGKAAIARCADVARYDGFAAIARPEVRVVVNPGGTNERFDRAHLHGAQILVFPDNRAISHEVGEGRADVISPTAWKRGCGRS